MSNRKSIDQHSTRNNRFKTELQVNLLKPEKSNNKRKMQSTCTEAGKQKPNEYENHILHLTSNINFILLAAATHLMLLKT